MNVVSLNEVRQARGDLIATATADATRIVETSMAFGQMLAGDAHAATSALPGSDRQLQLVVERYFLRSGLTRSRQSWREEYGREPGKALAKMAAPIVTDAFWDKLDEIDPLTCQVGGHTVPLFRGWRDASRERSA